MDKEKYQKIYDGLLKKFEEMETQATKGSCRFHDIAANMMGCRYYIRNYENIDNCDRRSLVDYLDGLQDYFNLLEKHPEFRDAELSSEQGAFPELYKIVDTKEGREQQKVLFGKSPSRAQHYVFLCKQKLEDLV